MTTPERLRRRQLIESGFIIILGIGMVIQSHMESTRDEKQDAADAKRDQKIEQTVALNSHLTQCVKEWSKAQSDSAVLIREATIRREEADQKVKDAVIGTPLGSNSPEAIAANAELRVVDAELDRLRAENPPPNVDDYCDSKTGKPKK